MSIFDINFWKAAADRAVKTGAQVAASYFVIGTTGLLELDWIALASVSGAGVVASLLTSLASVGLTNGNISFTESEQISR
jgi:serine phosphatase RsbU (regulator of sigma subunit)